MTWNIAWPSVKNASPPCPGPTKRGASDRGERLAVGHRAPRKNPPGNDHIIHLEKRTSIDSKVTLRWDILVQRRVQGTSFLPAFASVVFFFWAYRHPKSFIYLLSRCLKTPIDQLASGDGVSGASLQKRSSRSVWLENKENYWRYVLYIYIYIIYLKNSMSPSI